MSALASWLADKVACAARSRAEALVVGLTGPQGSGKSTLAAALSPLLAERGLRSGALALDDLYLPKADRLRLAAEVHPLFATRGAPGTHDPELGVAILESLKRPGRTLVPGFDKAADDRRADWTAIDGPLDVIVFEGWCVGARPQAPEALAAPVNALERERDPEGVWRRAVNDALAGPYQGLFAPIDFQILLRPPSFEVVLGWRLQQERELRAATGAGQTDAEIGRFVAHYERLTRHIDAEMPARADVTVRLGPDREALDVETPTPRSTNR